MGLGGLLLDLCLHGQLGLLGTNGKERGGRPLGPFPQLPLLLHDLGPLFLPLLFRHHPRGLHADRLALLEPARLTVLPGLLGHGTSVRPGAIVDVLVTHRPPEEGSARIAGDRAVVDVVVCDVAAHGARDDADVAFSLLFGLLGFLGMLAGRFLLFLLEPRVEGRHEYRR